MSENERVNWQGVLVTLGAVLFTWQLHEFFHWLTGELLGNEMEMTLNSSHPRNWTYLKTWHELIVISAGPLITLVEAMIVFVLLKRNKTIFLFPFLLACLYMRALAGVMNIIQPNDEGRLSLALGTDVFFLSLIITGILFYFVYETVKRRSISRRQILVTAFWIMLFSSVLILSDQIFHPVILR